MPGITVGIDGSHDAHRALEWSMHEAAARHAQLGESKPSSVRVRAVNCFPARELIEAGEVTVNGRPESRRGAQLTAGDVVACGGRKARVVAEAH